MCWCFQSCKVVSFILSRIPQSRYPDNKSLSNKNYSNNWASYSRCGMHLNKEVSQCAHMCVQLKQEKCLLCLSTTTRGSEKGPRAGWWKP